MILLKYNILVGGVNMEEYSTSEAQMNCAESEPINKRKRLFGFRSNKLSHKVIAVIYMIILAIATIRILFGMPENAEGLDILISDVKKLLNVALFASPFIFLSDFKYRDKAPFFKKRKTSSSCVGFVLIFVIHFILQAILGNFFSADYKAYLKQKSETFGTQTQETQFFATQEDYKQACQTFSYEDISRYPDDYKGKLATYTGKVEQVRNYTGKTWFRLGITEGEFDIWSDMIFVEFQYDKNEKARILEGDILTVYGELDGIKTYTAVLGNEVQIPHLKAKYIQMK